MEIFENFPPSAAQNSPHAAVSVKFSGPRAAVMGHRSSVAFVVTDKLPREQKRISRHSHLQFVVLELSLNSCCLKCRN